MKVRSSKRIIAERDVHVPMTWKGRLILWALAAVFIGVPIVKLIDFCLEIHSWLPVVGCVALGIGLWIWADRCVLSQGERLRQSRPGEGLCTFVRQFDCRCTDTLVLRVVYQTVAGFIGGGEPPLRRSDTIVELGLDGDDLVSLEEEVERLAGRSLEGTEANPWFDRVETLGDLVAFCLAQPVTVPARTAA